MASNSFHGTIDNEIRGHRTSNFPQFDSTILHLVAPVHGIWLLFEFVPFHPVIIGHPTDFLFLLASSPFFHPFHLVNHLFQLTNVLVLFFYEYKDVRVWKMSFQVWTFPFSYVGGHIVGAWLKDIVFISFGSRFGCYCSIDWWSWSRRSFSLTAGTWSRCCEAPAWLLCCIVAFIFFSRVAISANYRCKRVTTIWGSHRWHQCWQRGYLNDLRANRVYRNSRLSTSFRACDVGVYL